jgi:outer membrane cobalamin receptor
MTSEQTQLYLDGIPMNTMQTGTVDPGQFDLQQIDRIEIYRGGNARFGAGGTIGGAINLQSRPLPDSLNYNMYLKSESIQNYDGGITFGIPISKFRQYISFNSGTGENNYSVSDDSGTVDLHNRDYERWRLSYRLGTQLNHKMDLELFLYTFKFDGGSPNMYNGPKQEEMNIARISNDNNLASLSFNIRDGQNSLKLKGFIRNDWMNYDNPAPPFPFSSFFFNHETGVMINHHLSTSFNLFLNSGLESSWQKTNSSDSGEQKRERYAAHFKADYLIPLNLPSHWNLQAHGNLRAESYSDFGEVILPGAGVTLNMSRFKLFSSMGKNYRAPTFNELYYEYGGNPDLEAENAFNIEAGLGYENYIYSLYLNSTISLYRNEVDNQIIWMPETPTSFIWSPQNFLKVRSSGMELNMELADQTHTHRLLMNYAYGESIKAEGDSIGDPTKGNRLPHLPDETWSITVISGLSIMKAGIQLSGSSLRYLGIDNNPQNILPSYFSGRFWASIPVRIYEQNISLTFGVNNMFDESYQIMNGFPMPPKHYFLQLSLSN